MLSKENRLSAKDNFDRIKKEGKTFQAESFSAVLYKREDDQPIRIGIIISNKISKSAVARNRIKRILKEILLPNIALLKKGYSLIFLVKRKVILKTKEDLRLDMTILLEKMELKNEKNN
ncbi:ribonuclease P protein component [Candidatus Woesebacteria bacterium RBG_16_36_11]|uniref:Ribonuclease P protein component n=3 Tax=Candidatus Woeseibacteriota TaxID=1752722 RepID=A0A1F7XB63_9BACT|nr:MAG: ribonuclease P protein component [Candidatus Woesebacteria bacterium RBG_13_36_22]OGM12252.1 MAG: ribonuclease P protein component [Candidatus Woesebacteria bacterium RBG_16_36_11]OGM16330.1 MAG: ribonuclease P protein component [Candidatus Woesebacteria bacterium RBG_19FT_COMBO_37_29]